MLRKKIKIIIILAWFPLCTSMQLRDKNSRIKVSTGSTLVFQTQLTNFQGHLEREAGGNLSGQSIIFDYGVFIDDGKIIRLSGELGVGLSDTIFLDGNKIFNGSSQMLGQSINISGDNNRLQGEVIFSKDLYLVDASSSYTHAMTRSVNKNILLNGGTVYLEEDLKFVAEKLIKGPGTVVLNKRKLIFGANDIVCDTPLYFDNANNIALNAHTSLNNTWTFSGPNNMICGGDTVLSLGTGSIVVERGSTLIFHRVTIDYLSGSNIFCLDDSASVVFNNCHLILSSDFTFSLGSLTLAGDVTLSGTVKFNYLSSQPSTIASFSNVTLDRNMTFSYDPLVNRSDLIQFTDETSILYLNGSTIVATSPGMTLTKGTMIVDRNADFFAENAATGFVFGSGDAVDDFTCDILPGSLLSLRGGSLYYNNVNASSWNMLHSSSFFSIEASTLLHLFQPLDLGRGQLDLSNLGYLVKEDGVALTGSVNIVS